MMSIRDVRGEFPILKNKIFLNHASVSPLPLRTVEAMKKFINDKVKAQSTQNVDLEFWKNKILNSKSVFAKLIGARKEEIAYIPNTTFGLNMVAQLLPYEHGSNVVTNTLEYLSNVITWLKLREKGVEVHFVRDANGRVSLDMLREEIDDKTVAVAIGQVGWYNGFRHDLRAISEMAHEKGAFLVVDAIQSVGNMKIDVKRDGIDFLSCGTYKWLLGPQCAGFLFIKEDLIEEFNPPIVGENSLDPDLVEKNIYEGFDLFELKYSRGIGKYEVVHMNDVSYIGAEESMRLILNFGIEHVERKIKEIDDHLIEGLLEIGYELQTPINEKERHAIINFKTKDLERTLNELTKNGIVVSRRMGGIRVSPHFYNTRDEIDELLEILKAVKP
ncbi:MAG: aminotransferase class V-fold PLP-dependent enzyme [Candidatus Bathyarchaeia archaeon]|nr:aminotransferase class V-fold PLP-dependent enzyme [Candidatus Bathyarchaeota archaeon]